MLVALGFVLLLGGGMAVAFLIGGRIARSTSDLQPHGPATSPRRPRELEQPFPEVAACTRSNAPPADWQGDSLPSIGEAPSVANDMAEPNPPGSHPESDLAPSDDVSLALQAAAAAGKRFSAPGKSPFANSRKYPRSAFPGTAAATIYPAESRRSREPVQCTVLTRDLSRAGIGISHFEQLVPQQVIVLEAVGKLLVGEVRWCRRVDDNFFVAGCRLVKTTA